MNQKIFKIPVIVTVVTLLWFSLLSFNQDIKPTTLWWLWIQILFSVACLLSWTLAAMESAIEFCHKDPLISRTFDKKLVMTGAFSVNVIIGGVVFAYLLYQLFSGLLSDLPVIPVSSAGWLLFTFCAVCCGLTWTAFAFKHKQKQFYRNYQPSVDEFTDTLHVYNN